MWSREWVIKKSGNLAMKRCIREEKTNEEVYTSYLLLWNKLLQNVGA